MSLLTGIAKHLPYSLFLSLFYRKDRWTVQRRAAAVARRGSVPRVTPANLAALKRSDTLVVLGSGKSINDIPETFWPAVRRFDTAGMNFWLYHPFVPSLYFFEISTAPPQRVTWGRFAAIARERAADYAAVPKFATELHHSHQCAELPFPPEWSGTIQWLPTVPVPARSPEEFARGLARLRRQGIFGLGTELCFKQLTSLTQVLSVAAKLGYRRILLCGIDMTSAEYFYQDAQRYPRWHDVRFLDPAQPHPTAVPLEWRLPMQDVVREMRRQIFTPAGVEIYVQNASSGLHPEVPLMPPDFLQNA